MSIIIKLRGQKELEIYMHPLRQKILKHMRVMAVPMTSKQVATALGIVPSSAKHHLDLLRTLGLVELDHDENIRGITAHYLRLADVTVQIGGELNDEFESERSTFMRYTLNQTFDDLQLCLKNTLCEEYSPDTHGDMLTGVMHLTAAEFQELYHIVVDFLEKRRHPRPETFSYEYALLCCRAGGKRHES